MFGNSSADLDDQVLEGEQKWIPIIFLWIFGGCLAACDSALLKIMGATLLTISVVLSIFRYRIVGPLSSAINKYIKWFQEQQKKYETP